MSHTFDYIHVINGMGDVRPPLPDPITAAAMSYRPLIRLLDVTEAAWRAFWDWNDEIVRRGMGQVTMTMEVCELAPAQEAALNQLLLDKCPGVRRGMVE